MLRTFLPENTSWPARLGDSGDPHLMDPHRQSSQKVRCCDCEKMDTWMKTHLREAPAKQPHLHVTEAHSPLALSFDSGNQLRAFYPKGADTEKKKEK